MNPTTATDLADIRALVDEFNSTVPQATAKYTVGQEVYWGSTFCVIHDVNTVGEKASYLVRRQLEGEWVVAGRYVQEWELYLASQSRHYRGRRGASN